MSEYRDVRELRTALTINAAAGSPVNAAALLEMLDAAPAGDSPLDWSQTSPGVFEATKRDGGAAGDDLRAIVADVDQRLPTLRELIATDPSSEGRGWANGVRWMLDRLTNIANDRDRRAAADPRAGADTDEAP